MARKDSISAGKGGLFIACFCPFHDNVKTWNSFARGGSGYALEFELLDESLDTPGLGLGLFEVEYSTNKTRSRLAASFRETLSVRAQFEACNPMASVSTVSSLVEQAFWLAAATTAARTKSLEHSADMEWRLVALRTGNRSTVIDGPPRHVCIPLRAKKARPGISAVHIGREAPMSAERDVADLLHTWGYDVANAPKVVRSAVCCSEFVPP